MGSATHVHVWRYQLLQRAQIIFVQILLLSSLEMLNLRTSAHERINGDTHPNIGRLPDTLRTFCSCPTCTGLPGSQRNTFDACISQTRLRLITHEYTCTIPSTLATLANNITSFAISPISPSSLFIGYDPPSPAACVLPLEAGFAMDSAVSSVFPRDNPS